MLYIQRYAFSCRGRPLLAPYFSRAVFFPRHSVRPRSKRIGHGTRGEPPGNALSATQHPPTLRMLCEQRITLPRNETPAPFFILPPENGFPRRDCGGSMNHTAPHPYCGAEMPEPFGRGNGVARANLVLLQNKNDSQEDCRLCLERKTRLELATPTLARSCSTN